ncbi:type II toxin-antitoxin system PemK/MazF family toxin [Exiguobacterium antarcticum]|uniref:Type II toxin-antitoxin system PemK/MazF family toxin n=1 Tax=Exiguobacterium antarcticum TaxID=132920 RepID=A0ABT6R6L2_9BACL|nr:type II toxin-antitoxin system PemK/MazF family toxin [Exiguobacterium antarcticum]MDI3236412.1 type II toxin-antitoxin system PemK/MazF family toxin [Exiguobacterium antarcticum]
MTDESKRPDEPFAVGDVYIANLKYKDRDGNPRSHGEKTRPVVVMYDFKKNGVAFYMITSTVTGYLSEQFGCEIKDLKQAGLDRPSVVRMGKGQRYETSEANPLGRKIGSLSTKDMVRVIEAFERITRPERTRTEEQINNAKTLEISNEQKQKKNNFEQDR